MAVYSYEIAKNIRVTSETLEYTPHTFLKNGQLWESESITYFFGVIEKSNNNNPVIVDIGAQSGLYSLYAKFLPDATFYSFEPFELTYSLLLDNIKLNQIWNVKAFNYAIGSMTEKKILRVPLDHFGLNTLADTPLRFTKWNDIEIEVRRLDDLFYHKDIPVHYIKCDTEGWELNILKGGIKTIQKNKPDLFIEVNEVNLNQCGSTIKEIEDFLKALGYVKQATVNFENAHYTYTGSKE